MDRDRTEDLHKIQNDPRRMRRFSGSLGCARHRNPIAVAAAYYPNPFEHGEGGGCEEGHCRLVSRPNVFLCFRCLRCCGDFYAAAASRFLQDHIPGWLHSDIHTQGNVFWNRRDCLFSQLFRMLSTYTQACRGVVGQPEMSR